MKNDKPTSPKKRNRKKQPKLPRIASTNELEKYLPKQEPKGRPQAVTIDVLEKLKEAFLFGCTNEEAAHYAGIAKSTYYEFVNGMDEELALAFSDLVKGWKDDMVVKARKTMADNITQPENAKWVLERKRKDEFAPRTQHEVKEVTDFDSLDDEALERIANAGNAASKSLPKPAAKPRKKPAKKTTKAKK